MDDLELIALVLPVCTGMLIAGLCMMSREVGQKAGYPNWGYRDIEKADRFVMTTVAKVRKVFTLSVAAFM